jgi:hypothetical protein
MEGRPEEKKSKKGFFLKMFDNLDKFMQEKAKSSPCSCKGDDKKDKKSCCS